MIYFVRHGQSQANSEGVFAGQRNNSPLTEHGMEQAHGVARELKARKITVDRLIYSPLDRSKHTANIVAEDLGLQPDQLTMEDRLKEYDMGSFSGTPIHPITSKELTEHPETEDPVSFRQRITAAVRELEDLDGTTLVIGHDGVGRMLESVRRDIDPMHFYDVEGYKNGEIVELKLR